MKSMSPQSSFCSSDTTNAWPYPSMLFGNWAYCIFSCNGWLKNSCKSTFIFCITSSLRPWLITCLY
ncbi:hypothetical protein LINPERHAP1_LOCUS2752 [Linum perenne]